MVDWSADVSMILNPYAFAISGPPDPSIYNPAAWYDADDLSTLFQDAAGTVPVTTDGDPVGRWEDKSGNGRHFTQTTAGARPIWHTSGGFSWVEFDASNDWLFGATSMLAFATTNLFIGWRPVSGTSDFGTVISQPHSVTHTSPFYRWSLQTRTSGGFNYDYHINGTRSDVTDAAVAVGNDVIHTLGYSSLWHSPSSSQHSQCVRVNGAFTVAGIAGATTITYPNATVSTMGAQVDGGGDRFKGRIYSILIADAAVTSQAWIDNWETYIGLKVP